jgi:pyruvate formate lyase activating enzyme
MSLHPGRWWHREGEQVVCDLCPRRCRLKPGQRGFCFVRQADENGMQLTTWGRSSGFCIDPIEKKPLDHFLPGTPVLSFGTAGCNLGCRFCQNWDVSKAREMDRLMDAATPEMIAEAAVRTGCRSVAYTYNDPVIFAEYALDVAAACRESGIKNVAVSAGYITDEARAEFFRGMDATNIDLKGFTERFYQKLCFGRLGAVQDTLRYLVKETSVWTEITTLLIPEENDGDAEIDALSRWVMDELGPDVPLHFTAYHPDYKLDRPATPASTLTRARAIARANGLRFVYTGNVHDREGGSTYCPACGNTVIGRDWFTITRWDLRDGACGKCGHEIPGHFEERPGTWGAKRQPIRLAG